jgi:SAM-dependent methyltransferase
MPPSTRARLRSAASTARNQTQFLLGQAGLAHSSSRLVRDASRYWAAQPGNRWQNDSHWRSGSKFAGQERWSAIGQQHLDLFQRMRGSSAAPFKRVIEWGCGGGANAVAFAPLAQEFVGVDVAADSVEESARRVAEVCSTPFVKVVADIARPEDAVSSLAGRCDVFLCLYVLELVPTQEYGLRLMRLAHELLEPGGAAFVQIKYATQSWRTRSRRRSYRTAVAGITYRIEDFWTAMKDIGFRPELISLVPQNDLDERYAYFLLIRS